MIRSWFFVLAVFAGLFSGSANAKDYFFQSTYEQWIDPNNNFIDYFTVGESEQARVIFIGSSAFGLEGPNYPPTTRPTVSEGMGYGLLLSVANDDQVTFNKFLRYVIGVANAQGCSLFSGATNQCLAPSPFLMPWLVNDQGEPFWYLPNADSPISYFSSGSATDADIQIAWAIQLASKKVKEGTWTNSIFSTVSGPMTYEELFELMATQIRLNDIDLISYRYTPGSQWGLAGLKVIYPGYFTPQAFVALDKARKPDTSTKCPDPFPIHAPINSLQLVFKNNATKTVSIDFLGGNGGVQVNEGFVPKEGVPNGYTVAALTEGTAIFTSSDPNYANATIQATHYSPNGFARIRSNYFIEYVNGVWTVHDQGSTPKLSKVCQSPEGNVVYIFLTQPRVSRLDFDFNDVLKKSLKAISKNQESYLFTFKNTLLPNVIYYSGKFPPDNFSYIFGYDSCRFALWGGGFLQSNPNNENVPEIRKSLELLLSKESGLSKPRFIKNNTLPSGGIDVLTYKPLGNWDAPAIPLNATVMTGAAILGGAFQDIFDQLSPPVLSYRIVDKQPSPNDAQGDSSPYYNAATVLLSEAILNKKL